MTDRENPDRINDEPILFYLRHQELIETWAAVRKDVQAAAHDFYLTLGDDLGDRASHFGDDVVVWSNEGSWSKVGLYRPAWHGEDEPVVQVCLEWNRQATFSDGTKQAGVRVDWSSADGKAVRPHLEDTHRGIRDTAGFDRSQNHWPALRPAPEPDGEYWDDLSSYRELLLDVVESAWAAFSDAIDRAVQEWRVAGG
jgi:hypothetical protein